MPSPTVAIAKATNEIGAAEPERSRAIENKSPDGVSIFSVPDLNEICTPGRADQVLNKTQPQP